MIPETFIEEIKRVRVTLSGYARVSHAGHQEMSQIEGAVEHLAEAEELLRPVTQRKAS